MIVPLLYTSEPYICGTSHTSTLNVIHVYRAVSHLKLLQVNRGTDAMQNILSNILFSMVPQLVDVLIGSTYLAQV